MGTGDLTKTERLRKYRVLNEMVVDEEGRALPVALVVVELNSMLAQIRSLEGYVQAVFSAIESQRAINTDDSWIRGFIAGFLATAVATAVTCIAVLRWISSI